ncbi:hypothetical protein NONI108955_43505 [Nocardia ninae]|uniref:Uncharacterized protein n=2 Tax=Nocardia TaxID=1817 RepID=A0A511ML00_9NOCA|nr:MULTISPECIES: hypothetical protein [Nocardia]QBS44713.1 hypothetical protein DMB37_36140 [Nocardia sp. CS682]GEM41131.1 hypothetical protein NN4_56500 [Nocardia ninae NBRC 108245]
MTLPQWPDHDITQLREVADKIATLIQRNAEGSGGLPRFVDALQQSGPIADLLIEYSVRWFNDSRGESVLLGPELYWVLTETVSPEDRGGEGYGQPATNCHPVTRTRQMLLICVLEKLSARPWHPEPGEDSAAAIVKHRYSNNAVPSLPTRVTQPAGVEGVITTSQFT